MTYIVIFLLASVISYFLLRVIRKNVKSSNNFLVAGLVGLACLLLFVSFTIMD